MEETPLANELANLLEEALNQSSTLIISRGREYTASGCFRGQRPRCRCRTRPTLGEALLSLLGRERTKKCPGCGEEKSFTQYTTERARYDGLAPRCRDCDRAKRRRAA